MSDQQGGGIGLAMSFLGAPPDMADWRIAELAHRKGILATWLSEIEMAGGRLESGPTEFLARSWRRVQMLHSLGADLADAHEVTIVKGAMIARHMPAGVLRQSGDLDLVVPDEEALWRVVLDLMRRCDAVVRGLSVLRAPDGDRQLGVFLKWPAEEALLDRPMGADVRTCAFTGDLKRVGVRTAEIGDEDLLSVFAVAEERFQRKFRVGDLIDLAVLVPVLLEEYGGGVVDAVAGWAGELCLAPELLQLSRQVNGWWELPHEWLALMDELALMADDELEARRSGERLLHSARYGLALDDTSTPGLKLSLHTFPDCELATTPAGTFLLVDSGEIDEGAYQVGVAAARHLHRQGGADE